MSRGPGKLQKAVLVLLKKRGPLPLHTIVWEVALATGVVSPRDNTDGEVYNNNRRATIELASGKDAQLKKTEGLFLTLDDLLKGYPDRTKSGTVREMRQRLLPYIKSYLKWHLPRPEIATEKHVFGRAGSMRRAAVASRWPALEPLLLRELSRSVDAEVTDLLHVLTRGRAIVRRDTLVDCDVPLITSVPLLVQRFVGRAPKLSHLLEDLHANLPVVEFKRSRLRAQLQRVATFKNYGAPTLKKEFLDHLYNHEGSFLCGLKGHREKPKDSMDWFPDRSPEYSPLVHKLLDSFAFKPFKVYSLRTD